MPSRRPYTLEELSEILGAGADRGGQPEAVFWSDTLLRSWISALCQIADLSSLGLNFGEAPYNADYGRHTHLDRGDGEWKEISGAFSPSPDRMVAAREAPPGRKLGRPEFTLLNPDSYANLAVEYWMFRLGWDIEEQLDNEGNPGPPQFRRREKVDPSTLPTWPKNIPPNWMDVRTSPASFPNHLLPTVATADDWRVKRGDADGPPPHTHRLEDVPEHGNSSVGDIIESNIAIAHPDFEVLTGSE